MAMCSLLNSVSAAAEETNETISFVDFDMEADDIDDNQKERGANYPTQLWDWTNGVYGDNNSEDEGSFYPLYGGHWTYTSYMFQTNTGKLNVKLSLIADVNFTNARRLSVSLYQQEKGKSGAFDNVLFSLPVVLAVMIIYWFVRRALHKHRFGAEYKEIRRRSLINEIIRLLLVGWLAGLVCVTLTPSAFWDSIWLNLIYGKGLPRTSGGLPLKSRILCPFWRTISARDIWSGCSIQRPLSLILL